MMVDRLSCPRSLLDPFTLLSKPRLVSYDLASSCSILTALLVLSSVSLHRYGAAIPHYQVHYLRLSCTALLDVKVLYIDPKGWVLLEKECICRKIVAWVNTRYSERTYVSISEWAYHNMTDLVKSFLLHWQPSRLMIFFLLEICRYT